MLLEDVEDFNVIGPHAVRSAHALEESFRCARPFPHVVIDDFLTEDFVRALVTEFPPHDREGRLNEFGAPGIKVVHSDLAQLGPAYRKAHAFFGSRSFLAWLESLTGIDGLQYDPANYGGGTHENLEGRDLRPHIDFNIHPVSKLHRRVNLIVYLNERWQSAWGGNIMLHADPRSASDRTISHAPTLNRCIIFETSERSWHGFDLIQLPAGEKHRSRKSLSLYFYSKDRPQEEIHSEHTTFFVPRGLPERFKDGYTLTNEDAEDLKQLMGQRERLIALYQREQGVRETDSAQAARLRILVAELRSKRHLPLLGYAQSAGDVTGMYDDGWAGAQLEFTMEALRRVRRVSVRAIVPPGMPQDAQICVEAGGVECARAAAPPGRVEVSGDVRVDAGSRTKLRIHISSTANQKALGLGRDERDLGFLLESITFEHEGA